jgi:hypothetical protein
MRFTIGKHSNKGLIIIIIIIIIIIVIKIHTPQMY